MKHQISKVALIATLAFIGVGFAGTQQAKAEPLPCPGSGNCDEPRDTCYEDIPADAFEIIISPSLPDTYDTPKGCQTHCGQLTFSDGDHNWNNPCNGLPRVTWEHVTDARAISYKRTVNG